MVEVDAASDSGLGAEEIGSEDGLEMGIGLEMASSASMLAGWTSMTFWIVPVGKSSCLDPLNLRTILGPSSSYSSFVHLLFYSTCAFESEGHPVNL